MRVLTLAERERLYRLGRAEVARHYRRPLTVSGVARALGTSPRQLQRAYAQAGVTSFAEDLRRARLSAAAELLAGQPIAVRDVGRLVGYSQGAHFARAFRARYGMAPAAFRRAAREARAARVAQHGWTGQASQPRTAPESLSWLLTAATVPGW